MYFPPRIFGFLSLAFMITGLVAWTVTQPGGHDELTLGKWGPILPLETHPENMAVLPSRKVLMMPWAPDRFDPPHGPVALWDPATGSSKTYFGLGVESGGGLAFQPDGILLLAGGDVPGGGYDGTPQAWTFDYVSETFSAVASMVGGRVFPGATTLGTGEIVVTAGWDEQGQINGIPEIWDGLAWIQLPAAYNTESQGRTYQFLAADGRLFRAGPEQLTDWLDFSTEIWTDVEPPARNEIRHRSTAVMYDDGKVFNVGGCPTYDCDETSPVTTAEVIDLNAPSPAWRDVPPAAFARHSHHATLLPDGTILITGGTSEMWTGHEEEDGVLEAELWNPATEMFTTLAAMDEAHHHQSTAVLLTDGTVLVAGGAFGPNDVESYFSWSGQIYYPPYLDRGPRPTIGSAPSSIQYGSNFTVDSQDAASIANVNLIRLSATLGNWNASQRMVRLSFRQDSGSLSVSAPSDPNRAPPGFYILFILSDAGVPSVGSMIQIIASAPAKAGHGQTDRVNQLIAELKDEDWRVRGRAANTLADIGQPAVEPLIAVLMDAEWLIRFYAIEILSKIKDPRAVEPLISVLKHEDLEIRRSAVRALGRIGDPRAVEHLIAGRRDSNVTSEAFSALVEIGQASVEPLINLLKHEDLRAQTFAIRILDRMKTPRAVEPLIAALKDEDPSVRFRAARALGRIGDPRAVEPLIAALKDEEVWVRSGAAINLSSIGDPRAVEPMIALLKDEDPSVHGRVIYALGRIGDPRAVELLISLLTDEDLEVRRRSAFALMRIGDPRAVEPLINALKDEDPSVRMLAIEALGVIGDPRAVEPLTALLKDEDQKVQRRSALALQRIR